MAAHRWGGCVMIENVRVYYEKYAGYPAKRPFKGPAEFGGLPIQRGLSG
ncbi:MAG: hypothetical protein LBI40_01060 [Treponema sp.]|nr:hypothetical protein [Treponema sp.]